MKNPRFKNYIYWGTTALAVVACSVAFGFFLSRFEIVSRAVGKIVSILMPIIYGAVLAYLMLPIYNKTRVYTAEKLKRCIKDGHTADSLAKAAGTLVPAVTHCHCLRIVLDGDSPDLHQYHRPPGESGREHQ